MNLFRDKTILITGGTGSFGKRFTDVILREGSPKKVIIFSRDELKQHDMRQIHPDTGDARIRYFIGDVRDRDRLNRAFQGVDIVVHAAAMKQVPACEYNPFEAVLTNIMGAKNVIDAAIDNGVSRVLAVSTDKAVSPVNLYGATKLVAEKLFVQGNAYAGSRPTIFACTRYGNVVGSRGSVIPLFQKQKLTGTITLTDPAMTRFWITLDQGIRFVIRCLEVMEGGEVFVPKIPSMKLSDLADTLAEGCAHKVTGIRPGEKVHEILVSADESRQGIEFDDMYVIRSAMTGSDAPLNGGKLLKDGFCYTSDTNAEWLSGSQFRALLEDPA